MSEVKKFNLRAVVNATFDKALESQQPFAIATVERLRRVHPDKSPAELIKVVNKYYLGAVTATGAGAGAAAITPNLAVQVPVAIVELGTFLEASVLYTLTVAEIHGLHLEDIERRRLLVTAVLVGNTAVSATLESLLGRTVPFWGKKIVSSIPMATIDAANKILGPRFITKYGTRQGILVLGKQVPLAIGVAIGAGGNNVFGHLNIKAAKTILGPPPASWDLVAEFSADANGVAAEPFPVDLTTSTD
ncbi:hypothetical protein [Salinibacterium sp. NK8237]|uniref:hypothetical protein n=1 Tax=Salinibacterium sp. NK8237 TaxID=2792038 RepID=UPI0018CDDA6B|nr:hypothetical protein [Salinibacterium sp. NK8237]MBH0130578.1 hypothetical protein [Salinibacterium sp. NK8237]